MARILMILTAVALLAACGGGSKGGRGGAPNLYATGPIQKACQTDRRKASSRARCGCIQAVADRELSNADQRRGAKYFKKPGKLQEVRQSDSSSNERFWKAWKAYGQKAESLCSGT